MKNAVVKALIALAALVLVVAGNRLTAATNLSLETQSEKRLDPKAETLFEAKYQAYVTLQRPAGQPLAPCEACILQCAQNALPNCRASCAAVCGLE